tara:strand:- start:43 stop:216 length:174 start_codon:yes stop_codon:yes gene_type:complete
MESEYIRISHSIDQIDSFKQVPPTFQWIKRFEEHFMDEMGVGYKAIALRNQLKDIEL